jgi:hypothetical protein
LTPYPSTLTISGTLTTTGTFSILGSSLTVNGNIEAQGNVDDENHGGIGNPILTLDGNANQTIEDLSGVGGGQFRTITINKTGGTVSLACNPSVFTGLTLTAGTVNTGTYAWFLSSSSPVSTAPGTNLGNIEINGSVTVSSASLQVANLTIAAVGDSLKAPTGNLSVSGNWNNSVGGTFTPNGGTVVFDGSGSTQQLTSGGKAFDNLTIAAGASVILEDNLTFTGTFTNNGTFNPNGHTVNGVQFLDDSNPGFSATGGFEPYNGAGFLGNFHYAGAGVGNNLASWAFTVTPGQFDVAVTWVSSANRGSNAPYTVLDGTTPRGTVLVNQTVAPSGINDVGDTWQDLGAFNVSSDQLVVHLSDNANGFVIADAVRIVRLGSVPTVQVQDGATLIDSGGADSFGSAYLLHPMTKTFTITNYGTQTLTLTGEPNMPTGFVLTQGFGSTSLAVGASTTFQVTLTAASAGSYSGALSFPTSDSNFPTYSFTVSGTVVAPPTVQVVDDSQPGFSATAAWESYTGVGYDGNIHYAGAGVGNNLASWTFTVSPGQFDVEVTWPSSANRATNAQYMVLSGSTLLGTVLINQQNAPSGGQVVTDGNGNNIPFQELGTFNVTANQLVVELSDNANGYVFADAVRIQRLGNVPTVQVQDGTTLIDSGGADSFGTTYVTDALTRTFTITNNGTQTLTLASAPSVPTGFALTQGFGSTSLAVGASTTFQVTLTAVNAGSYSGALSFTTSDSNSPTYSFTVSGTVVAPPTVQIVDDSSSQGFAATSAWMAYSGVGYLGNMHYIGAGSGANTASWTFTVQPGQFDVAATWTALGNHATNAPYTVLDGSTPLGTVLVNQQVAPSSFSDQGGEWQDLGTFTVTGNQLVVQLTDNGNGYIIADAIRIQRLGPVPTVEVEDGTTPVDEGGSDSFGTAFAGANPQTRTFAVKNNSTQTLTLNGEPTLPSGFTLTQGFGSTTLAPGAMTTFQVTMTSTAGSYSGTLSWSTSDANFPTFSFTISGTVSTVEVIDDSSPGYSQTSGFTNYVGTGFDNDFDYAAAGIGSNTATWTTSNVMPGTYNVQMTWVAGANRATNATYMIYDGSALVGTVSVNQQNAPSGGQVATDNYGNSMTFQSLGTFTITSGALTVVVSDNANGFVIADAMLLSTT